MAEQYAIEMRGITKTFGSVAANRDVQLAVRPGEILALLGENGSGKTTLMNMLSGIYKPDSGEISVQGRPVSINSPEDAKRLGIGMVHQHFKLVDVFSAADNIWLGEEHSGLLLKRNRYDVIRDMARKFGFEIDPRKKVYHMSVSEKQTLEIIKVLCYGARVIILDEPTAVLTVQETQKLFGVLRRMKAEGATPSSSSPTRSTRCWRSATGWPSSGRGSTSPPWTPPPPASSSSPSTWWAGRWS